MPIKNPIAAGIQDILPIFSSTISMAGIKSDQMLAATITPAAKPDKDFWTFGLISSFMKKTQAAPKVVPMKGINMPKITCLFISFIYILCKKENLSSKFHLHNQ